MSPRRIRIRKVADVRNKELQKKRAELEQRRVVLEAARLKLEQERLELDQAAKRRELLSQGEINALAWSEADEWLASREQEHDLANSTVLKTHRAVEHARENVLVAHSNLRRLEKLDEKLDHQEQRDEARREQKLTDEHAARSVRGPNSSGRR
jgi:flagellar export protein FliJ